MTHCPLTRRRIDRRPRLWWARCDAWFAAAKARGSCHRTGRSVACPQRRPLITPEQHAEIRRLYYGEHWKVGTIAAGLGLHHDTVRAAIADRQAVRRGACRATQLDPYLPFVRETLAQYPRLRATRLFEMVRPRGYPGSVVQLRRAVRLLRPPLSPTLYRRLNTLMAEEAQVDWGAFGSIRIGHGTRPLSGFVMVLSYSRAISALFTLDQTLESFLRGHVEAFDAFGGCARTLVYDNLRSAVLDRCGAHLCGCRRLERPISPLALGVTPHVSQNVKRPGGSAIDGRTTRHDGYALSQSCRPRVERVFGWIKPIAGLRKIKLRGLAHVEWLFVFACAAFNLKRLVTLRAGAAA